MRFWDTSLASSAGGASEKCTLPSLSTQRYTLDCACACQATSRTAARIEMPTVVDFIEISSASGPSGGRHSIMTQKRVDLRLAPAESDEGFEGRAAAAGAKHLTAEAFTDLGVEHSALLERAIGVRRKDLGPLVAVVARGIAAGEDVGELVGKAAVCARRNHRDLRANLREQGEDVVLRGVESEMQSHVEEREFKLAYELHAALEILR